MCVHECNSDKNVNTAAVKIFLYIEKFIKNSKLFIVYHL